MTASEQPVQTRPQMIAAALKRTGIDLVTFLPDVWMTGLVNELAADPEITMVRVACEQEGVGICAGAFLGGRKAVLIAQNAGLLLSANALAGMAMHHQIPILILVVQRGGHDDDQYYQIYKGRVTVPVIEALNLPYHHVDTPDQYHIIEGAYRQAVLARMPVAVLLSRRALMGGN